MRPTPLSLRLIALSLAALGAGLSLAQTPTRAVPAEPPALSATPANVKQATEQRGEHIRVEDAASIIDEVRVGGETKSIDVQPKGGMPSYQIAPKSGERSWKVLGF